MYCAPSIPRTYIYGHSIFFIFLYTCVACTLYIYMLSIHICCAYGCTVHGHYVHPILYICYVCTLYVCMYRLLDSGVTVQNTQSTPHTLVCTHTLYTVYSIWLYLYSTTHYICTIHISCTHIIHCTQHPLYT